MNSRLATPDSRLLRLALALTCVELLGTAQSLRGQSDMAFPPDVYAARRAKLVSQTGASALIVPGRYLVGAHELPRQDPDFWYLTGVESPYAILVMAPDQRAGAAAGAVRTALFLPDSFQFAGAQFPMIDSAFRRAAWNRPVRRLAPGAIAARVTGIDETYPVDEFATRIAELIGNVSTFYLPLPADSLFAPPGFSRPLTIEQQFARAIAARFPGHRLLDVSAFITPMRLVKDRYELDALREAARISAESMRALMRAVRPGMNDLEAAGLLEYEWKRHGSPRAAFAPIVGSGPNAMRFFTVMGENYSAVGREMRAGDLLFVDYGAAEFRTYASDICRTLPVSGRFSAEQRKYYDIVLEAQEAAIARIKPGTMMLDVIKAAAEVYRKHGLERFEDAAAMGESHVWGVMPSPTHYLARDGGITRYSRFGAGVRDIGHHIGLEATDSRDWSRPLEAGMVVTVEPKLYIPDSQIAIMIEDMILVTPAGHQNLSAAAPKRAADVERAMRAGRP
ncbi:MAG TPA: Xaa-Pro peptidase family protein [Gemmatimonadaceae bacterium]|nr:Xaa-Pro peptidase family protein [Gemmatimonadaceae bacterium]